MTTKMTLEQKVKLRPVVLRMSPGVRELLTELRHKLNVRDKRDILASYDVGTIVGEAMDADTYGENVVNQLAEALDEDAMWLYRCQTVAKTWKRDEVEALTERRTIFGRRITFTHLTYLAEARDCRRDPLTERVFNEGLSTRDLKAIMDGSRASSRRNMSVLGGLSHMEKVLMKSLKLCEDSYSKWDISVFEKVVLEDKEAMVPDHLEAIDKVKEQLTSLQKNLSNLADELEAYEGKLRPLAERQRKVDKDFHRVRRVTERLEADEDEELLPE